MISSKPNSLLKSVTNNSFFLGLGSVANLVLGLLFAGFIIRYLNESRAGFIITIQAIMSISVMIGDIGLNVPALRRLSILNKNNDLKTSTELISSLFLINLVTALSFVLILFCAFPYIFDISKISDSYHNEAFWTTILLGLSIIFMQLTKLSLPVLESNQRYDILTFLNFIFPLLTSISGIIFLNIYNTMITVGLIYFVFRLIELISVFLIFLKVLGKFPILCWNWKEIKSISGFAGWNFFGLLGALCTSNFDRILVTYYLGSSNLPYYAYAQRICSQIHTALSNQVRFLLPMLSSFEKNTAEKIRDIDDRMRWFIALISVITYGFCVLYGPQILSIIVSPEFSNKTKLPLYLACIQGIISAQIISFHYYSWSLGKGAPNALTQFLNGLFVILSMIILIPLWGYVGASIAHLWVILAVIFNGYWVMKIISTDSSFKITFSAYYSPIILMIIWSFSALVSESIINGNLLGKFFISILTLIIGLISVWLIETRCFSKYDRWSTLISAFRTLIKQFRNSKAF